MEILAANLAAHLMEASRDPMEPEIVLVQSRGMERWLSMELARWSGVCANISFLFPGSFMERCFLPPEEGAGFRAWDRAALRWSIFHILQTLPRDPDFSPLDRYTEKDPLRSLQLAEVLAGLFDEYLLFRPQRVLSWEKGQEDHFQAKLWRLLREKIASPHRLDFLKAFFNAKKEEHSFFLPARVSVFGVSALPPLYLSFLEKLAEKVTLRWYLLDPCREYWGDISGQTPDLFAGHGEENFFHEQDFYTEKGHPLLASMGKTGRDFFKTLAAMGGSEERFFVEPGEDFLLHRIQSRIGNLDLEMLEPLQEIPLQAWDDSVRVHACHGPMREMEVLRDELLRLFSSDNPPAPREILVMFPDIGAYAPYVEAVFGQVLPDGGRIPFRIADRNFLAENRLASLLVKILSLFSSRFTASEVFDILEYPVVAGRFNLSGQDLDEIRSWILDLRISWGLDGEFKELQGIPAAEGGTWKAGMDRMVLGVAMEDSGVLENGLLPYEPMLPEKTPILSGFLDFMESLTAFYEKSGTPRSMLDWVELLRNFLESFFEESPETEQELIGLRKVLDELSRETETAAMGEPIPFSVFRFALEEALLSGKSLSPFLGGGITFCAMVPMRCVPFSMICLCGMNEGDFPRKQFRPAFDFMAQDPKPGDRSRRDDDRYLFLETLLSARDRFWITYTGFRNEDNSVLPPSVPVQELLQATGEYCEKVFCPHPMQAFSPSLFRGEIPGPGKPASFSERNLAIAREVLSARQREVFVFQDTLWGVCEETEEKKDPVHLSDLLSFFRDPAVYFLKKALGIRMEKEARLFSDEELFSLTPLDRFLLVRDFCENFLQGSDESLLLKRLDAENRIPCGETGKIPVRKLAGEAKILSKRILALDGAVSPPEKLARLDMGGFFLEGGIPAHGAGHEIFWRAGVVRPEDLITAWLHFLFRKSLGLDTTLFVVGAGKKRDGSPEKMAVFDGALDAKFFLSDLLSIFEEGRKSPLPFFPGLSRIFVEKLYSGKKKDSEDEIRESLLKEWEKGRAGQAAGLLWQGKDPLVSPFGELAERIWKPLLGTIREVS